MNGPGEGPDRGHGPRTRSLRVLMGGIALGYRSLLWLLPRGLRVQHGQEMDGVFRERAMDALAGGGARALLHCGALEAYDVVRTAVRLRFAVALGAMRSAVSPRTPRAPQTSGLLEERPTQRARRAPGGFRPQRLRPGAGGVTETRGGDGMVDIGQDLSLAARVLARRPGFAAVAVLTLALGIGANTAIFTVVDNVLIQPLPYVDADRLMMVWRTVPRRHWDRVPVSYPTFIDWRKAATAFEELAAYRTRIPATLTGGAEPERVRGAHVTGGLFRLLGAAPAWGRPITEADDDPAAPPVVVLSHDLWRGRFGGDPGVVGRSIELDARLHTVIGVMPPGFSFPSSRDRFWVPLRADAEALGRDLNFLTVIGRLGPDATVADAQTQMEAIAERLRVAYPGVSEGDGVRIERYRDFVIGDVGPVLLVLLGAVGLVLAIACVNLASLFFTRTATRGRELAVRAALGAGRRRLLRQLLSESLLLAIVGGALGAVVAVGLTDVLLLLGPAGLPRRAEIAVDARAIGFTAVVSILSGLLFGLVPAFRASAASPGAGFREGGRGLAVGPARSRFQRALVVAQIGLATVLLIGAGLLMNSFVRLTAVEPGFDPERVLTARVAPPAARYPEPAQVRAFYNELLRRLAVLPGVRQVGATWAPPLTEGMASGHITVEGQRRPPSEEELIELYPIQGDYFKAIGVELLAGRVFTERDGPDAPPVAIVNETAAERYWPGENAIGRRLKRGAAEEDVPWITVVGVVADVKRRGLDSAVGPEMHQPYAQVGWGIDRYLVVRTEGDPLSVAEPLRRTVWSLDPDMAVSDIGTMDGLVARSVAGPRFRTVLIGSFAALACLLALIGIYGVMAYMVAQRRHEIGVRVALGAGHREVMGQVLGQGLRLIAVGLLLGGIGAVAASRALGAMLFGVTPLDATTYTAALGLLAAAALLACYLPAHRASRVDPMAALRQD